MSTALPVPKPSPAPPTKLQNILSIINAVLTGLTLVPGIGTGVAAGVSLEQVLQGILTNALAAYQQETGKPIDLTAIPQEALVP
jgi:hypothetical protein